MRMADDADDGDDGDDGDDQQRSGRDDATQHLHEDCRVVDPGRKPGADDEDGADDHRRDRAERDPRGFRQPSGRGRTKALWEALGNRTIKRLADGARTLAVLWNSACVQGGGEDIADSRIKTQPADELKNRHGDKTFAPNVWLKDSDELGKRLRPCGSPCALRVRDPKEVSADLAPSSLALRSARQCVVCRSWELVRTVWIGGGRTHVRSAKPYGSRTLASHSPWRNWLGWLDV
jgi:hypothetical protein